MKLAAIFVFIINKVLNDIVGQIVPHAVANVKHIAEIIEIIYYPTIVLIYEVDTCGGV